MSDLPILFRAPMVRALSEGHKTQTRRIITRLRGKGRVTEFGPSDTSGYDWHFRDRGARWHDVSTQRLLELLPYRVGDRLWVKETFAKVGDNEDDVHACPDMRVQAYYRADSVQPEALSWRPSIFMPRWASRIALTVTGARIERLQDISASDAFDEGIRFTLERLGDGGRKSGWGIQGIVQGSEPCHSFSLLWDEINGHDAWAQNPWIARYAFTVALANIDAQTRRAA
jgi:hypothetical protein